MLAQPPVWFILLAFLAAIGPLVVVHELGHYAVARLFGVGAEGFSIGFGREVIGWTDRRGTRWKVGWLPLGGYVRFLGDEDAASTRPAPGGPPSAVAGLPFHDRPVWQRFLIVVAGPLANFLLAIALMGGLFAVYGKPDTPSVVSTTLPGSAAAGAGIAPGDRILSIAGRPTANFEAITDLVVLRPGELVPIEVERAGQRLAIAVTLGTIDQVDRFGQHYRIGQLGISGGRPRLLPVPAVRILPEAARATVGITRQMADGLWQLVSGRRSIKDLNGPLKMAQVAGQRASLGLTEFTQLLVLFSINLGFINLLPVPMLDGGHLAMYAIEAVRRRPVSPQVLEWAFRGGMALLLAVMLIATVNDLGSFGLWDQVGRLIG